MAVTRLSTDVVDWAIATDGESIYYTLDDETQLDDGWKSLRSRHDDVEYGHGVVDYSEIWNLNLQTWKHSKVWDEDAVIQFFSPSGPPHRSTDATWTSTTQGELTDCRPIGPTAKADQAGAIGSRGIAQAPIRGLH